MWNKQDIVHGKLRKKTSGSDNENKSTKEKRWDKHILDITIKTCTEPTFPYKRVVCQRQAREPCLILSDPIPTMARLSAAGLPILPKER